MGQHEEEFSKCAWLQPSGDGVRENRQIWISWKKFPEDLDIKPPSGPQPQV